MLEYVNSWLYFGQDENKFINPLLQVPVPDPIRRAKNQRIRSDPDPHPCIQGMRYSIFIII